MKKMKTIMMTLTIATASLSFTSCDEGPWDEPWGWDDPYGWSDNYSNWGWNENEWNNGGQNGSHNSTIIQMAQTLCGEWYGTMDYSYINEDGNSRTTESFYADMKFWSYENSTNFTSGSGSETDYIFNEDGTVADQQTLDFSWYIEDNGDIYIKYKNTGATFVLDYGSSQAGFHLGAEQGKSYDTFYGYMIGTGSVKGDVIYFDLERQNTNWNSKQTRSTDSTKIATDIASESYGNAAHLNPLRGTTTKLNNRR